MAKLLKLKVVIFLLALNLFTYCGYSQNYDEDKVFYGGVLAGLNYTQVDGDNFAGYHKVGFNFGGIVYATLKGKMALSMEMLYSQRGSKSGNLQYAIANDKQTIIKDYRIRINYAEVPILLNYFDGKKSNFGGGFSYGQLISSKETYRTSTGATYEQDAKLFPFKKYDLNLILNGNVKLYKSLFFNLRFQYSMLSIRSQYNYLTGRAQQFNNLWSTRFVYIF